MSTQRWRLPPRPGEVIDRSAPIRFTWRGRPYSGYAGDTIASALAASGVRVFSRSLKYHRPRGLLTASYHDPGVLVQVGPEPNVRGGHRLAEDGMDVRPQNVWPNLRFDVKAANRLVGRFLSPGFYYKTFMRPRRLWPAYEHVLQRFAPGGSVPDAPPPAYYDKRYAHPDVVVAGGGPAGMAAAVAAAQAGARVLLVEEEHALGGHLRWGGDADRGALAKLVADVAAADGIEVLTDSVVAGRYDGNWLAIVERSRRAGPGPTATGDSGAGSLPAERLIKARAGTLVVAAGLIERPYVFAGNDLPGVLLSTGARRLLNLYAVRPGERAVVLTANADGDAAAADLAAAGVEVARVLDARRGHGLVRARGRNRVQAVDCSDGRTVECDLLVTATGWTAPTSLLNMAGDRPVFDPRANRFFADLERLGPDVLVAGGLAGDGTVAELVEHARAVGREAARRVAEARRRRSTSDATVPPPPDGAPEPVPALGRDEHPPMFTAATHGMVDFAEDVSSKDLVSAVAEGYDSAELAKRYTTATMGPTQGKLELVNTVAVLAAATDRSIAVTGTTTWRPPYAPVTLGALAGRRFEPVRHSPLQPWHEAHGARPLVAGTWIRPDHYGDPVSEVRTVRERVGLIDVTPIGKLDLYGPDVPKLLNLVYTNKWSRLEIGRVRYGVMCAEDGVVLDDGVTGRLGEHRYLMSTTSSGAETVEEWLQNWLQLEHTDWQVAVTPVTTAYASMNLAGPHAREVLRRVVDDVDLDPEAFPYLRVRTGSVAGVAGCVLWRIGFTGELSYELHVPAGFGLAVWEALLAAGRDFGIGVFGVEAQRILRLEKGHLIVGQDTDGLTTAASLGMDWVVKLDKDDFAGKPELAWRQQHDGQLRLVALQPVDGSLTPPEASQILEGHSIVGRVTSSRWSPTLGRSIGLALVAPHLAMPGTEVTVHLPDGRDVPAVVQPAHAHVDPEGVRLRE
jgi:sarcosine oxidase, subunit alpha